MLSQWSDNHSKIRDRYIYIGQEIARKSKPNSECFDFDGWQTLCQEKLWQMITPAEYGGNQEVDWWAFTAALDGLSCSIRRSELLLSVIAQAGIVRALALYGSPEQKTRYYKYILEGKVSATGIAEPTTGTDIRDIGTRLTIDSEGNGYVLTGEKYNIAHAPIADFLLIIARSSDSRDKNITLVLIDNDIPGLRSGVEDDKLGNRNLPTGALHFDKIKLSKRHILGAWGEGLKQLINIISLGRAYYGLIAANLATPFLSEAIRYTQQRKSFNTPLHSHQYIQKRLVDIKINMEKTKWMSYAAIGQLLQQHPDAIMNCSIAKLAGADALINNSLSLVKLYGSTGYHTGDITELTRNALGFASVGGTEEMHRKNIYNQINRMSNI